MPTGKGRRPAPPGYMSASDAGKLLGESRIYKLVDADRLHRYTPTGMKHGFYAESEVNTILAQDKAFYEERLHKVSAKFCYARPSDMQSLYNLATRMFGSGTIPPEKRAAWIEAERRGNYLMKRPGTGEVIAYYYMQALSHSRIMQYLKECRGSTIKPEEILSIEPGTPLELIVGGIGRDPRSDKQLMGALLHGVANDLEEWGRKGIVLSKLFAYSETVDGIFLCFSMGMQLLRRPRYIDNEGPFFTFVLDVQESNTPLLRPYKRALAQYRASHGQHAPIATTAHIDTPVQRTPRQKRTTPDQESIWSQERIDASSQPAKNLPDGWMTTGEFARLHDMREASMNDAIRDRSIQAHEGPWKAGKARPKFALDKDQQASAYRFFVQGNAKFTPCPACPHALNQSMDPLFPATDTTDQEHT